MDTPLLDRVVLLTTRVARPPEDDAWLAAHVPRLEDADELWRLADDNRVAPRVHAELARLGLLGHLPEGVRERFSTEAARVAEQNRRRLEAAAPILRALVDRGVDVVALKGAAFAGPLYGDLGYKRMNDVDLLVPQDRIRDVIAVYRDAGLIAIGERVAKDPERQLRVTHHLPPYVSRDLACVLGTQWSFRSPLLGHRFDLDAVRARARPLDLAGVPVRALGPEDAIHHVALHLERYKTGARDLMDLHNLVAVHRETLDWALLRREVERAGTEEDVWYALTLAQAHRPFPEVEALLSALSPRVSPFVRRVARARTRSTRVLLRTCSRQFAAIEKAVSAFNATDVFAEKLPRYLAGWGTIFWPPAEDVRKIVAEPDGGRWSLVTGRARAPVHLLRAIAGEIGGLLLLGLAVKSTFDLAASLLPWRERKDLDAYAASLGLTRAQLTALEEHLQ
jgi:hypothetical protein